MGAMMSTLNIDEFASLERAGFTRREISTQQRKFYNLFRINPFLTTEIEHQRKLKEQRDELLAALRVIANSEEHHGDTVVCDFETLQSVARAAIAKATGVKA